jgi:hypothetical protein
MRRVKHVRCSLIVAWLGVLTAAASVLSPAPAAADPAFIDEVKLGILAHDVHFLGGKEEGADINGEILFRSPVDAAKLSGVALPRLLLPLLTPRPDIGFEANTASETSQVYLGLTWTWLLARDLLRAGDGLDLGLSFGPSFNNGEIQASNPFVRESLGSHVLFRGSIELGYRITPRYEVSLFFDHESNAGLAKEN